MIRIKSPEDCGDDVELWRGRYVGLRDRWRELEQKIKAEIDAAKRNRLEAKQREVGADRNRAMGRIAELVNRINEVQGG